MSDPDTPPPPDDDEACFHTPEYLDAIARVKVAPTPLFDDRFHHPETQHQRLTRASGKVPRARNPFILYRSHMVQLEKALSKGKKSGKKNPQSEESVSIAAAWHLECQEIKNYYVYLAELEKLEHHALYPDYKYTPQTKEEKLAIQAQKAKVKAAEAELKALRGSKGRQRAASARKSGGNAPADIDPTERHTDQPVATTSRAPYPPVNIPKLYQNDDFADSDSNVGRAESGAVSRRRARVSGGRKSPRVSSGSAHVASPATFGAATHVQTPFYAPETPAPDNAPPADPIPRNDYPAAFVASWTGNFGLQTPGAPEPPPPTQAELDRSYLPTEPFSSFGQGFDEAPLIQFDAPPPAEGGFDFDFGASSGDMSEQNILNMLAGVNASTGEPLLATLAPSKDPFQFELTLTSAPPNVDETINGAGGIDHVMMRWGDWENAVGPVNSTFYSEVEAQANGRISIFDFPPNRMAQFAADARNVAPGSTPLSAEEWAASKGLLHELYPQPRLPQQDGAAENVFMDSFLDFSSGTSVLDVGSAPSNDFFAADTPATQATPGPSTSAGAFDYALQDPSTAQQWLQTDFSAWGSAAPTPAQAPTAWSTPAPIEDHYTPQPTQDWGQQPQTVSPQDVGGSSDEDDYSRPRNYTGPIDVYRPEPTRASSSESSSGTDNNAPVTPAHRSYAPPTGAANSSRRVGGAWMTDEMRAKQQMKSNQRAMASRRIEQLRQHQHQQPQAPQPLYTRGRNVFSASYAEAPSSSSASTVSGSALRSTSTGGLVRSAPNDVRPQYGPQQLMRTSGDSPYLYAPSPEAFEPEFDCRQQPSMHAFHHNGGVYDDGMDGVEASKYLEGEDQVFSSTLGDGHRI